MYAIRSYYALELPNPCTLVVVAPDRGPYAAWTRRHYARVLELLTLWAKDLQRRGMAMRVGFPFEPQVHLAASAFECLLLLLELEPEHLPTLRRLDALV